MELNHPLLRMMDINLLGNRIKILEAIKDLKREYHDKVKAQEIVKVLLFTLAILSIFLFLVVE